MDIWIGNHMIGDQYWHYMGLFDEDRYVKEEFSKNFPRFNPFEQTFTVVAYLVTIDSRLANRIILVNMRPHVTTDEMSYHPFVLILCSPVD